jgi:hypothetical protein
MFERFDHSNASVDQALPVPFPVNVLLYEQLLAALFEFETDDLIHSFDSAVETLSKILPCLSLSHPQHVTALCKLLLVRYVRGHSDGVLQKLNENIPIVATAAKEGEASECAYARMFCDKAQAALQERLDDYRLAYDGNGELLEHELELYLSCASAAQGSDHSPEELKAEFSRMVQLSLENYYERITERKDRPFDALSAMDIVRQLHEEIEEEEAVYVPIFLRHGAVGEEVLAKVTVTLVGKFLPDLKVSWGGKAG